MQNNSPSDKSSDVGTPLVWEYREGQGQDPQAWAMLADSYGAQVRWPAKVERDNYDEVAAFFYAGLALACFYPATTRYFPAAVRGLRWILLAWAMMLAIVGQAASVSVASNGGSAEITVTYVESESKIYWTRNFTESGGSPNYSGQGWLYHVSGDGSQTAISSIFDTGTPGSASGNFVVTPGQWYGFAVRVLRTSDNAIVAGPTWAWVEAEAAPETYGVTFTIPANNTPEAIVYMVLRGGQAIRYYRQESGAAAHELYVGGLDSPTPVPVLVQITGGEVLAGDDGSVGLTENTEYKPVNNGTTPTPETSPGAGATAHAPTTPPPEVEVPANPTTTPTAPPIDPATPAPPVTPTAPLPPPKDDGGGPGGGGTDDSNPATTGAIAQLQNTVAQGANKVSEAVDKSADGIIEAVNAVGDGVQKGNQGVVDAINTASTAAGKMGDKQVARLDSIVAALSKAEGVTAPTGVTNPSSQSPGWSPGSYNVETKLTSMLPVAPTIQTEVSSVSAIHIQFQIPVPSGSPIEVNKTIDFAEEPWSTPIAIFRALLLVFVTLTFYLLVFWTVRGAFTTTK